MVPNRSACILLEEHPVLIALSRQCHRALLWWPWTVPAFPGQNCRMRVMNHQDSGTHYLKTKIASLFRSAPGHPTHRRWWARCLRQEGVLPTSLDPMWGSRTDRTPSSCFTRLSKLWHANQKKVTSFSDFRESSIIYYLSIETTFMLRLSIYANISLFDGRGAEVKSKFPFLWQLVDSKLVVKHFFIEHRAQGCQQSVL